MLTTLINASTLETTQLLKKKDGTYCLLVVGFLLSTKFLGFYALKSIFNRTYSKKNEKINRANYVQRETGRGHWATNCV